LVRAGAAASPRAKAPADSGANLIRYVLQLALMARGPISCATDVLALAAQVSLGAKRGRYSYGPPPLALGRRPTPDPAVMSRSIRRMQPGC
jgi:hypothetical protein